MDATRKSLSSGERLDWLRLIRSENVGPVTFHRLLDHYGSASQALDALPELAAKGGARRIRVASKDAAESELEQIGKAGAKLIALGEEYYPPLLGQTEDAPPLITVAGHPHLLAKKTLAVVGARNASLNGLGLAERLARDIGGEGYLIASGMARGIDRAAHEGALETGTAAVLAGGVDVIYPRENADIYRRITERGAALSEMPPATEPKARHFPRRNRIISGMARGVLVIEATKKSGSLITARFAADQNREVFAVPGSPLDPRAQGANHLIKEGAHLVQSAADIMEILSGLFQAHLGEPQVIENINGIGPEPALGDIEAARGTLKKLLGPTPIAVDELIRRCQMSLAVVSMVLLELELAGRLERHPGNQVSTVGEL
ncbi:MAG: DNA-processing protein DprA [Alphaproteobacteria bacterium]|jgi:DNA processing protein|nr:DNA-protecting protein DprA [Rhodospirillaceae bacterium]MDP6588679.1 DNA-processing protein DprA [Alphaproteobacteria bacterium]MDP6819499.1 DNA-processing protein DprA [Alphaproteobacteria bacterium]|tara:strand:+ start:893 stop:2020 length:1128 start_codon:yes stop_codon:yes gene_type:complete